MNLQTYSAAVLAASKPKPVDIELSMNLGERYARKLCTFINRFFHVLDFSCEDNGIAKEFMGISLHGEIRITITIDPIRNNHFKLESNKYDLEFFYSSYDEYMKELKAGTQLFIEESHENSTIFPIDKKC